MSKLTPLEITWYKMAFKVKIIDLNATAFEDFFKEIMNQKYGSNFLGAEPWGQSGDFACDGYLIKEEVIFQSYSPKTENIYNIKTKIQSNFDRAKQKWPNMKKWIFVYSYKHVTSDIPSPITQFWDEFKTLEANCENPIELEFWCSAHLESIVLSLNSSQLINILGHIPTEEGIKSVDIETIDMVISKIQTLIEVDAELDKDLDFQPVPLNKIKINNLNSFNTEYIMSGEKKSYYIDMYIRRSNNEQLIDDLSTYFKNKYEELKKGGNDSNSIFFKLLVYMGYDNANSDIERGAYLAIMSYLFNNCTIFERE